MKTISRGESIKLSATIAVGLATASISAQSFENNN